ncbi:protein SLC31A2-like [Montipora capricornis]|uniref:protein SLC31A2-like n=1 Tax=Montipora capricornis TaxID=246305 RepID=UPI0035F19432
MTFSSVIEEMKILIRQWKVTSMNGLSGSVIAVLALAVLHECLNSYHRYLRVSDSKLPTFQAPSKSKRIKDHILRTGSYVLSAICGYLLMLVVGTYNVWLFASIVLGAAFGYYLSDPLFTSYSSIEYRDSEIERRRNNDNYKLITSTCNRC